VSAVSRHVLCAQRSRNRVKTSWLMAQSELGARR
jgi:hypothetical protein